MTPLRWETQCYYFLKNHNIFYTIFHLKVDYKVAFLSWIKLKKDFFGMGFDDSAYDSKSRGW